MNVIEMTLLMSTPINPAICGFCDVARIAMPIFVLCTSASSPAIIASDVRMITTCTLLMAALVSELPK